MEGLLRRIEDCQLQWAMEALPQRITHFPRSRTMEGLPPAEAGRKAMADQPRDRTAIHYAEKETRGHEAG